MGKILFLAPYPYGCAASQRYRFEQYLKILDDHGYECTFAPFFGKSSWDVLYKQGHYLKKTVGLIKGMFSRVRILFQLHQYDWIFIHRETIPAFPPFYEWFLSRVLRKKIIFDFDDAIWIPQVTKSNQLIAAVKYSPKTSMICRLSQRISVGNAYLAQFANNYHQDVHIVPTTIDTKHLHNRIKSHQAGNPVVGWTGSHSTMPYLQMVLPAIQKLEQRHKFKFLVISDKRPDFNLSCLEYVEWNIETEIEDLMKIDIGLMPLPETEWAQGKCGLKALQYMALGIPALVSPVGVNRQIVSNSIHGFHCHNENEWFSYIEQLLFDHNLRNQLGKNGRAHIEQNYSVKANFLNFLALFK